VSVIGNGTLQGRVALVTGAARGIGRAVALELATRGAAVALNYHTSRDRAESLALELEAVGAKCMLVQGDVACREEAQRIIQEVRLETAGYHCE